MNFEDKIIRLGSRSKSEKILPKTLYNVKRDERERLRNPEFNRLIRDRNQLVNKIQNLCEDITKPCLPISYVKEHGLLSDKQLASLEEDDWVTSSSRYDKGEKDYLREWLEQALETTASAHNKIETESTKLMWCSNKFQTRAAN